MDKNQNLPIQRYTVQETLPANSIGAFQEAGGSQIDVQLREYIRIFYKYRLIIVAIFVTSVVFSLISAFLTTPKYTAQSTIRISSYQPVLAGTSVEQALQSRSQEANFLETQIQEIRSYSIADRVLLDPEVSKHMEELNKAGLFSRIFGGEGGEEKQYIDSYSEYKNPIQRIKGYLELIGVSPVRRTSLVKVNSTTKDPNLSAMLANKHAVEYIEWTRSQRVGQQARGLEFLKNQSAELREKVADLERELADYAEDNSIVAVNKDENITAQKLSQINSLLTAATGKRIESENAYQRALQNASSAGYDDTSTQAVRSELAKLEAEYSLLAEKFTDSYPKMKQLKSQIEQLKKSVSGQRSEIVEGLKAKAEAAKLEEENLIEELEKQKSSAFELSKKQVQYNILNRELSSSRELLQNVVRQIKETSLAVESNATNVSIVDYAVAPKSPSYPRKRIFLLLGAVLGAGLGILTAFILHLMDNSIRTPEDVNSSLKLPSLGVVPSFDLEMKLINGSVNLPPSSDPPPKDPKSVRAKEDSPEDKKDTDLPITTSDVDNSPVMFVNNPRSLAAEAYRTIRTGILLSQAGEPPRTILVTSSQSSEGKTTTSINLSASLASAGAKVVLVDADLRRPSVPKHFDYNFDKSGLVEVITGQIELEGSYVDGLIKRVTVVPGGSIPPNPAELLGSLEMASIIDRLAEDFDYVIIDSPPILPVTDSVILSRYVDGVVLVVKGGNTPRKVVQDARDRLRSVGARILGAVVNDVDVTGGDYYYYNRYYHSYYSDEDATKSANA